MRTFTNRTSHSSSLHAKSIQGMYHLAHKIQYQCYSDNVVDLLSSSIIGQKGLKPKQGWNFNKSFRYFRHETDRLFTSYLILLLSLMFFFKAAEVHLRVQRKLPVFPKHFDLGAANLLSIYMNTQFSGVRVDLAARLFSTCCRCKRIFLVLGRLYHECNAPPPNKSNYSQTFLSLALPMYGYRGFTTREFSQFFIECAQCHCLFTRKIFIASHMIECSMAPLKKISQ
jgi:hypothetical protein